MAVYRVLQMAFWTDSKVDDDFTPEDKYFYLYLLTNPHTNLAGCYEVSMKQMTRETGYNEDTIMRLLKRMESEHNVIRYSKETKEVLILNWSKYNWTASEKYRKPLLSNIEAVKCDAFRSYLTALFNGEETENQIPYRYPIDTTISISIPNTNTITNSIKNKVDLFKEFAGEDKELLKALKDFSDMRTKTKRPMTDKAKEMLLRKLETFPAADWIPVLEQSTFHCWQSIYPLKEEKKGNALDAVMAAHAYFEGEER